MSKTIIFLNLSEDPEYRATEKPKIQRRKKLLQGEKSCIEFITYCKAKEEDVSGPVFIPWWKKWSSCHQAKILLTLPSINLHKIPSTQPKIVTYLDSFELLVRYFVECSSIWFYLMFLFVVRLFVQEKDDRGRVLSFYYAKGTHFWQDTALMKLRPSYCNVCSDSAL